MLRLLLALVALGCAPVPRPPQEYPSLEPEPSAEASVVAPEHLVLSLIATNDVHGHLERMPHLAGFVSNVRRARSADGGLVLLVDGGDMWQGTLASNMTEGAAMVRAFDAMGYDAAAVGNHELDYGPVGDATTPQGDDDDPRGALRARAAEAHFPILSANFRRADDGAPVDWSPVRPSVLIERNGLKIGIVGLSTIETPETTISANVSDIRMAPLDEAAAQEATRLREMGATIVIITAHAGAHCTSFDDPDDLSSCEHGSEIIAVAEALPDGLVDAVVGGHTHQAIAHRVRGIPVLEQYSYGYAFGRVDLVVDRATGRVVESRLHPPHEVCQSREAELEDCEPGTYEGLPVSPDPEVLDAVRPFIDAASTRMAEPLGVTLGAPFLRSRTEESALGNLLADLMLEVRPSADVAILNGGGVRADFDEGPLTYGELYETFPFDNRFAMLEMTAEQLGTVVAQNLSSSAGTLIFAGLDVLASCGEDGVVVTFRDRRGRAVPPQRRLKVVTSDFLALTPMFRSLIPEPAIEAGEPIRESLAARLRARGGTLEPGAFHRAERPRVRLPEGRPMRCP